MLRPVVITANYKVQTTKQVTLEDLCGINLPLMFPMLQIWNRTGSNDTVSVSLTRNQVLLNQNDPDFNGTLTSLAVPSFNVVDGSNSPLLVLNQTLEPGYSRMTTLLTLSNAGPAAEALVTVVLHGLIESSASPDPNLVIQV